jgi:hypothetical protein
MLNYDWTEIQERNFLYMHPLNMYPNPLNEILKKRKNIFLCRSILVAQTYNIEVTRPSSLLHDTIGCYGIVR